jgi:RNA-directed DNA polymerase
MKESYGEGLATHTGPESCVAARKGSGEALTGERAGQVFSRERTPLRDADAVEEGGRPHLGRRFRETPWSPARSETLGMPGRTSRENRESPWLPVADGAAGRVEKSKDTRR